MYVQRKNIAGSLSVAMGKEVEACGIEKCLVPRFTFSLLNEKSLRCENKPA